MKSKTLNSIGREVRFCNPSVSVPGVYVVDVNSPIPVDKLDKDRLFKTLACAGLEYSGEQEDQHCFSDSTVVGDLETRTDSPNVWIGLHGTVVYLRVLPRSPKEVSGLNLGYAEKIFGMVLPFVEDSSNYSF